jgi:hypothetical protein
VVVGSGCGEGMGGLVVGLTPQAQQGTALAADSGHGEHGDGAVAEKDIFG